MKSLAINSTLFLGSVKAHVQGSDFKFVAVLKPRECELYFSTTYITNNLYMFHILARAAIWATGLAGYALPSFTFTSTVTAVGDGHPAADPVEELVNEIDSSDQEKRASKITTQSTDFEHQAKDVSDFSDFYVHFLSRA